MKLQLGVYRHYRNRKEYRVLGIAKHSETLEDVVVYQPLYTNDVSDLWVRPHEMFVEMVEHEGKTVPRFEFVREN